MRRLPLSLITFGLSLFVNSAVASTQPIAQFTYVDTVGVTTQQHIIAAYQRALALVRPNALKQAVNELKQDVDGTGSVNEPTPGDVLFLERGRGKKNTYSGEVLLAVPVTLDRAGVVDSTGLLVRARYDVKMGETVTITFKEIVELKPAK